jgi:hypothetical protein
MAEDEEYGARREYKLDRTLALGDAHERDNPQEVESETNDRDSDPACTREPAVQKVAVAPLVPCTKQDNLDRSLLQKGREKWPYSCWMFNSDFPRLLHPFNATLVSCQGKTNPPNVLAIAWIILVSAAFLCWNKGKRNRIHTMPNAFLGEAFS